MIIYTLKVLYDVEGHVTFTELFQRDLLLIFCTLRKSWNKLYRYFVDQAIAIWID